MVAADSAGNWTTTGQPIILADRPVFEAPVLEAQSRPATPSGLSRPAVPVPPADFWPRRLRDLGSFGERRPVNEMHALREILGEPDWPVPEVDWAAVHARLGTRLPADYREFIDAYGAGTFRDIRIAGPGAPGEMDLFALLERKHDQVSRVERGGAPPYHPEPGGSVCWGETVAGLTCAWAPTVPEPDEWTVNVVDPGPRLGTYHMMPGKSFTTVLREHARPAPQYNELVPAPESPSGPARFTPYR